MNGEREMTLVERLRDLIPRGDGYNDEYAHTLCEAADEIERLQQQVTDLTNLIDTVMAIPYMTDAQLKELADNCKKVIREGK
jgi:hypothetical protein